MYICIYIYLYIYVCVCVYVFVYTYIHKYIDVLIELTSATRYNHFFQHELSMLGLRALQFASYAAAIGDSTSPFLKRIPSLFRVFLMSSTQFYFKQTVS